MAKAAAKITVAFAGRSVPAWLVTRPDGEKPDQCLAWSGGWVSFGAHVKTNCMDMASVLRKIGYLSVTFANEPTPRSKR